MEQNRIRLVEKLDRCFVEHLRRASESDRSAYPADLIAVYEYLKGTMLKDSDVWTLLRYPDPLKAALVCRRRSANGSVFDLRFLLAKVERGVVRPLLIVGVRLPSSWQESSRKRREKLMGSQQILYGGEVCRRRIP